MLQLQPHCAVQQRAMVAGLQAEHAAAGQQMERTCMVCCSKVLGIMLAVEYAGLF